MVRLQCSEHQSASKAQKHTLIMSTSMASELTSRCPLAERLRPSKPGHNRCRSAAHMLGDAAVVLSPPLRVPQRSVGL